jgi:hypothetical protein
MPKPWRMKRSQRSRMVATTGGVISFEEAVGVEVVFMEVIEVVFREVFRGEAVLGLAFFVAM